MQILTLKAGLFSEHRTYSDMIRSLKSAPFGFGVSSTTVRPAPVQRAVQVPAAIMPGGIVVDQNDQALDAGDDR